MTFSGGYIVFVGTAHSSLLRSIRNSEHWSSALTWPEPHTDLIYRTAFPFISQAQTEIFAKGETKLNELSSCLLGLHKAPMGFFVKIFKVSFLLNFFI